MTFRILYRDEHLVAVSKPPGLLVHRSAEAADRVFLLQELRNQLGGWVYPVHRLDRAASGVVVFALSSAGAAALQAALENPGTEKDYLALARGETPERFEIDRPLTDHQTGTVQPARTAFERLLLLPAGEKLACSLLRARIFTGRRHQIRRHLASRRHFVLGDRNYGKGPINNFMAQAFGLPRLFLHACRLALGHPASGARLEILDPLPDDLRGVLLRLGVAPDRLVDLGV